MEVRGFYWRALKGFWEAKRGKKGVFPPPKTEYPSQHYPPDTLARCVGWG